MHKAIVAILSLTLLVSLGITSVKQTEAQVDENLRAGARDYDRVNKNRLSVNTNTSRNELTRPTRSDRTYRSGQIAETTDTTIVTKRANRVRGLSVVTETERVTPVVEEEELKHDEPEENPDVTSKVTEEEQDKITEQDTTKAVPLEEIVEEPTRPEDTPSSDGGAFLEKLAVEIHRLTNVERDREGFSPLAYDSALEQIAKGHSEDMAENNYFSHTGQDGCTLSCRILDAGYSATTWGENIAWISNSEMPDAETIAQQFVDSWMDSDGHRENILQEHFTNEGIGVARVGNKVYATANFSRPR